MIRRSPGLSSTVLGDQSNSLIGRRLDIGRSDMKKRLPVVQIIGFLREANAGLTAWRSRTPSGPLGVRIVGHLTDIG